MAWSLVDLWYPGETDRAADLDAQNADLNRRREQMGRQTADESAAQESRFNSDIREWNDQVYGGFADGAKEGAARTADAVRAGIAGPIAWVWRAIPWQLWAIGAVALFIYAGGGVWLRGALARR